jgi:hypothetical protein
MCKKPPQFDFDFVRRVGKEIVCCLLPDELPYFDVIWQAIEPMLKDPAFPSAGETGFLDLIEDRLSSLAFATRWAKNADLWTVPLVMVLRTSLDSAIARGVCSEDDVGQIVAERSLRWPIPERFLHMVQMFVAMICGAIAEPSTEMEKFISRAKSLLPLKTCYYVFHDGSYHYYPDELPAEVARLQSSARFWINQSKNKFFSCGQEQEGKDYPKGKPQAMLRFLCLKENAGQTVSFGDIYKYVWRSHDLPDDKFIRGSIDGAETVLNRLAHKLFIVLDKTRQHHKVKDDALILRFWGEDKYKISPEAPKECCIISKFELPE